MTNKKKRITIVILGFFVISIPLIFLYYNINREISFTKDRIEEDLREKLLNTANEIEEKLNPDNYLKAEFNKIHANLFPQYPEMVLDKIPEASFSKSLYTEETYNKLLSLTKERFSPIIVTLGTENCENIYSYFSTELDNAMKSEAEKDKEGKITIEKEKERLLYYKSSYDIEKLKNEYNYILNSNLNIPKSDQLQNFKVKTKKEIKEEKGTEENYCYKYISRFSDYEFYKNSFYSDYFNKQKLFSITGYTFSQKGIHGFYTCLIPQSYINPELIFRSAKIHNKPNIKIDVVNLDNSNANIISRTKEGFEYKLKYPTIFISQINAFKRLRNKDYSKILNKQIKIIINYPQTFKYLYLLNKTTFFSVFIIIFLYILFSIKYIFFSSKYKLKLSIKLIIILAIILLLPIIGIGILSLIISNNFDEIIDKNVSDSLHNNLENYYLLEKEKDSRRLSFIFDMKRSIANLDFENLLKLGKKDIITSKLNVKWYRNFTSDFYIESENYDYYRFDEKSDILKDGNDGFDLYTYLTLKKYLNNLGIYRKENDKDDKDKKDKKDKKDNNIKEKFSLSLLDSYISPKQEEIRVGQESIPCNDFLTVHEYISSSFYYAKDKKHKNFYCFNRILPSDKGIKTYDFLKSFNKSHETWFKHQDKYSNGNLVIFFNHDFDESNELQIPKLNKNKEINYLIKKAKEVKYSEKEKIKDNNGSIINEWVITKYTPFIIGGTVRINHNTILKLLINLVFPVILTYAILLLVLLSGFISCFINTPIDIYKEAIVNLENNHYGATIKAFSKDEFNSITNAFNEMSIALKEKEQIKRYVSDRLVQSVESNNVQEAGDGKQEKVTILSSDIRNFTGISEKYEPSEIVEMLNSYFTKMQKAISENGGIIDKYIGDAIQAVFYDEQDKENQVIRATKAAIKMRKALKEFNEERKTRGLFSVENGIGIDTDFAITGTIGTTKGRKDFSVNGDVITRAAELEAKTKGTTSKILISKKSLEEATHPQFTTNHAEASASANNPLFPIPSSLSPKNMDCHENKTVYNTSLVYREFDKDSVELIDVRQ